MPTVISKDGTRIAFDRAGDGPPIILVDGALCYRASGPMKPLAALLSSHFTVFTYDRRGRGESGDTGPYAVEREVEDIEALVGEAGGWAYAYGVSSGAALVLEAANRCRGLRKLAVYEAPFIVDDSHPPITTAFLREIDELVAADRRSDAVKLFMKLVGLPGFVIALMRWLPAWSKLEAVAHTLPYDLAIVKDNQRGAPLAATRWSGVLAPTLVAVGGKSPQWMTNGMHALARVLPRAQLNTLPGQTHMVKAKAQVPMLVEFFKEG
jgi:pimeloyl-ACP methyl ester carboxylesterase